MIQKIGAISVSNNSMINNTKLAEKTNALKHSTPAISSNYTATGLINAYQAFHGIQTAKTVSFGKSLTAAFKDLNQQMRTCHDEERGLKGEPVGSRVNVTALVNEYFDDLPNDYDAIKTNIEVDSTDDTITDARTQLKKTPNGIMYEMAVRNPRKKGTIGERAHGLQQLVRITQDPNATEKAYVLNTKGKLMGVVEDGENVILTNAGKFSKHNDDTPRLEVEGIKTANKDFVPFTPEVQEVKERVFQPSIGKGTEIVIGMEDGRFVPEIIKSIETFVDKVNKGEIILDQFVANDKVQNTQLAMLAGGFGSRAEYTNASSDGIFHGNRKGAQSTKGVFRTATGLTPMETTFISLHNAGLLDCSKGNLKIGDNIKFYLNQSGVNKGNGGFTVDLYNKMEREGRESLTLFPNDSMSRMPVATEKMSNIMNSGKAAIVMIAKGVKADDARGNFGIMKLSADNEILEFAEKPKVIPEGYENNGMCLTNTFQFSVSKEAFKALSILEPHLPPLEWGFESRDWSKVLTPSIMGLALYDEPEKMQEHILESMKKVKEFNKDDRVITPIPLDVLKEAKEALGNQKVYAVPTDEPWADCGSLNALYHTTMQIASNDFPLEDFERKHVLDSINTQTGLVASTPEQKKEIQSKYYIEGEVMAVPKAEYVDSSIVDKYIKDGLITVNKKQK